MAVRIACVVGDKSDSDHSFALRFEVKDTGIGMSEDAVKHVFESFTPG